MRLLNNWLSYQKNIIFLLYLNPHTEKRTGQGLIAVAVINDQSLEDIVKKYSAAIKADQLATVSANGMEAAVITFDTIEVNIPMEDSFFKLK